MGNGYPDTLEKHCWLLDNQGCIYGRETREKVDEVKDLDADGCLYGQENRRRFERLEAILGKILWTVVIQLFLTVIGGTVVGVIVYTATH